MGLNWRVGAEAYDETSSRAAEHVLQLSLGEGASLRHVNALIGCDEGQERAVGCEK